ncbi:hypothetical protein O0I10_005230 [Lichtheimia ornata]|uniref:C2H2-type domain-containing protein n=1 Tax=Lichtheimia ornata TaxID=688661 RepID=A0AAD7V636_9FUNG|nr:uncharacterized protein O0I10_005230 [Lichtheimia ornata]KAJ8659191.1 hypothetical protein O0I10_005230 [Lichtheimia ornata]
MALPFDVLLDDILFADTTFASPSPSPPAIVPTTTTNTVNNNNNAASFGSYCQQGPSPQQQPWVNGSPLECPSSTAPIMIPEYPKANTIAGHMEHYPMQQQHYVDDNACVLSPVLSSSEGSCSSSCYDCHPSLSYFPSSSIVVQQPITAASESTSTPLCWQQQQHHQLQDGPYNNDTPIPITIPTTTSNDATTTTCTSTTSAAIDITATATSVCSDDWMILHEDVGDNKPTTTTATASSHRRRPRLHHCPYCTHTSNRANNMKEHILTHDPHRPKNFPCPLCGKRFARKHDMKRHTKSPHHQHAYIR